MKPETEQRLVALLRRVATEASKTEDYLRQVQDEDKRRHAQVRQMFKQVQARMLEFIETLRRAGHKATVELSPGRLTPDPGQSVEPRDRIATVSEWSGPTLTFSVSLSDDTWRAVLLLRGQRETIAVESTVSQVAEGEVAAELSDDDVTDELVEAVIIEFLERWAAAVPPVA